jgi:peptidoglycan hydrolase FlgJ
MQNAIIGTGRSTGLPAAGSAPRDLREATGEFESLFITQIMQAMRATVPESGLMGDGGGQRVFREMLDQELSRHIAHAGGLGIGEILYRQLTEGQTSPTDESQEGADNENR